MLEILFQLQQFCVTWWLAENPTVCISDYSLYIVDNYIHEVFFSFSITPLNLAAVLPSEDLSKWVKMPPTTEATALTNNKRCRNTPRGFWQAVTFRLRRAWQHPGRGKHISLVPTFQKWPHSKFYTSIFRHVGKDMDHFLPDHRLPSSLVYIYRTLPATMHLLNLNQC